MTGSKDDIAFSTAVGAMGTFAFVPVAAEQAEKVAFGAMDLGSYAAWSGEMMVMGFAASYTIIQLAPVFAQVGAKLFGKRLPAPQIPLGEPPLSPLIFHKKIAVAGATLPFILALGAAAVTSAFDVVEEKSAPIQFLSPAASK